jgi:tetratricopeptide (TPR) repeat protein
MRFWMSALWVTIGMWQMALAQESGPRQTGLAFAAPIATAGVASDNSKTVVWLQPEAGKPAFLVVLDSHDPEKIIHRGEIAVEDPGVLSVSADGSRVLIAAAIEKPKYNTMTKWAVSTIDLREPDHPVLLWRKEVNATKVSLAKDASAYAFITDSKNANDGRKLLVVSWVSSGRQVETLLSYGPPDEMLISDSGNYVATTGYGYGLNIIYLASNKATQYGSAFFGMPRFNCLLSISRSGHAVMQDSRQSQIGIYAAVDEVPRISKLSVKGSGCDTRNLGTDDQVFVRAENRFKQIDIKNPNQPADVRNFEIESDEIPLSYAGNRLYLASEQRRRLIIRSIAITPTLASAQPFDWAALSQAYDKAMLQYRNDVDAKKPIPDFTARFSLERAGILPAIESKVSGITDKKAAAILNDYAFLLGTGAVDYERAADVLRRALELDPHRKTAYLNLADLLRSRLGDVSNWQAKLAEQQEIIAAYKKYESLGGTLDSTARRFIAEIWPPEDTRNWCSQVAEVANRGQLGELISDLGFNLSYGHSKVDVFFTTEGTAHVPTIYAADSVTDVPLEIALPAWSEGLWGGDNLGLLSYAGRYHVIHYRDARHPIRSFSLEDDSACEFSVSTAEVIEHSTEPTLCQSILDGVRPVELAFNEEPWITSEDVRKKHSETRVTGVRRFNVTNDDVNLTVGRLDLSSGAGAGCESVFYELLDDNAAHFKEGDISELLSEVQSANFGGRYPTQCGNDPRFFEHNGEVYFESRPAQWPPADQWTQYHYVKSIQRNKVVDVCSFSFATRVRGVSVEKSVSQKEADTDR